MAPSATSTAVETIQAIVPAKKTAVTQSSKQSTALELACHGDNVLPGIPTFPSFAAQRQFALNHLAASFRHWSRDGYVEGMSGHISIRDPEYQHAFWTNPVAVHFGLLKASDMILLSEDDGGKVLAGNRARPANAAGWLIHSAIHRSRRDINAACHAHTHYGKAWSAFGKKLDMINQDVCNFYGEAQTVYDQYGGVVLAEAADEGEKIAAALGEKGKVCLLINHGLLSVGSTVDEAAFMFGLFERSCGVQLEVERSGLPKILIDDKEAEFNFRVASDPETLFWEFQPYYEYEKAMRGDFEDMRIEDLELTI